MERKIVEFLVSGKSFNAICQMLRVGRRRVAYIREMARVYGYLDQSTPIPPYPEALFPNPEDGRALQTSEADRLLQQQRAWIEERLQAGWQPITLYEELNPQVGRSSFYRYLHRHKLTRLGEPERKKVIQEIIHAPGEALIVDWGKLRHVKDPETGKKRILWMFVGILGHSRYLMVRLVWSNDVPITLIALEEMFREMGGVPKRIISDNPKCFALEASKYEPLLNPAYERFAAHYGTQIECLPPRAPELKGKVERMMPFIRRLYQAHGQEWDGLSESQSYLGKKVALANERKHGTTGRRPVDLFLEEEVPALKSLPALGYEIEEFHEGCVRKDGHVRFRNKYYSVEERYQGQRVVVIGNSRQVSIYHGGQLIDVHDRISSPYQSKSTKDHHKAPWERSLQDGSYYRKRAAELGPSAEIVILRLLQQGNGFIDTRKIWGILSLDKKYPAHSIDEACAQAVSIDSYSYRTILSFLERGIGEKEAPQDPAQAPLASKASKFIRPMQEYQQQVNGATEKSSSAPGTILGTEIPWRSGE